MIKHNFVPKAAVKEEKCWKILASYNITGSPKIITYFSFLALLPYHSIHRFQKTVFCHLSKNPPPSPLSYDVIDEWPLIPAVQINYKLKSEFPQEWLCPPNKEGLPRKIPNFCRKRHNGVEMEKQSCGECVSGFQRFRLQTPVIAVNYIFATTMTFLKI